MSSHPYFSVLKLTTEEWDTIQSAHLVFATFLLTEKWDNFLNSTKLWLSVVGLGVSSPENSYHTSSRWWSLSALPTSPSYAKTAE